MRLTKNNKKFIYLISPNKIKDDFFYSDLASVLSTKKVSLFQLRLKKETHKIVFGKNFKRPKIKTLEKNAKQTLKAHKKADKSFNKLLRENNIYQPSKANNELYSIQLKSAKNEFPELVPFENILFEITKENVDFTPALANKDWDDIQLKRKNKSEYLLIMFDDLKKHTFIVRPVISASNIEEAKNVFENLLSSYDDKLGGKLLSERTVRDSLKKVYKAIS